MREPEAPGPDESLLAARAAIARGDVARFEQAAARVGADHPLRMHVDHWRLRAQLAEARGDAPTPADAEARAFVERHAGTLAGDLARRDWLASLGRRQAWDAFDEVLGGSPPPRDDLALRCHALQARLARGETVVADAREPLMQPRDLPEACMQLLSALVAAGQAGAPELAHRLEAALDSGSPAAVRRAVALAAPGLDARQVDAALARPVQALEAGPSRDLALVALATLARTDPAEAAQRMATAGARLRSSERAFVWGQIAANGMRRLAPESLAWAREARGARASDDSLGWIARAGLRGRDWAVVRGAIERMSEAGRADPTWTYWLGRAVMAQSDRPEAQHQARVLFTSIAGRADFYSQLAGEELGLPVIAPPRATPPTPAELAEVRAMPGLVRAFKWYELGLRQEGNREWNFSMRGLTDRQLIAAAEHGRQRGMLDRAVNAADRTRDEHDFTLRFPMPFAERLVPIARQQGVDPAWVYGLIRQESRFVADARSPVGASGLMQIMPATARWIAKKMGAGDFEAHRINELETNLQFGSFYLRTVHDGLDRSMVLASAGYNAGPGRPRSWRGTLPQPLEGAAFAEIIPFNETRGYVKHVLSNAAWYAAITTGQPQSLKALLGEIQPGPAVAPTPSPGGD
ncbi:MAG TPA: transglycosylase SLT domain-containing protein [Burkholderiaceae bacterium]|nr:transglycosylase SLT domain-containing protein [Burkholderiaceae bacterium]